MNKKKLAGGKTNSFFSYNNKNFWGYLFIMPGILGLLFIYIGPMIYSLFVSFTEWDLITPLEVVGLDNYTEMLGDELVLKSLTVTFYFTLLNVPAIVISALFIAMLLNASVRHMSLFRTIYYIPAIIPAVANSALWMFLYNPMFGLFNKLLNAVGLPSQEWIFSSEQVIPSIVLMSIWGCGNTVVIYLAGLQGISKTLYEAIAIDGGGAVRKFFHITLPMMSSIIFFNILMTIIASLQTFTQAYIMTNGGPNNASMFYILLLYETAFSYGRMGYASAMAWVLFVIIAILTALTFKASNLWVFYEGGKD